MRDVGDDADIGFDRELVGAAPANCAGGVIEQINADNADRQSGLVVDWLRGIAKQAGQS